MFSFTVIYYLLDYFLKSITVDGEKITLWIADTAAVEQIHKFDNYFTFHKFDVSWTFQCYIKDIQRTVIIMYR